MNLIIDGSVLVADHFSGIGHYLQGIVEQLDKELGEDENRDLNVSIVVPYKRADRLEKYHFKNITIKKIPLPMSVFRKLVVKDSLPKMDTFFGKGVYFFPDYNTWPLSEGSRAITTVHDLSFIEVPQYVDDTNAAFLKDTLDKTIKRTAKIATVTHTMKQQLMSQFNLSNERVIVTENAADTAHFYKRSETEIKEVKKRHKIYGDYILSVGNIEPRKNQLSLVKAMYDLPDELKEKYTLLFVGAGGWKMEQIQAEIDDAIKSGLKVQILQGRVSDEDLPAIYSGASMMGYVSHYEGFGMPIVEAMACGVPVITSNTSVMPEVAGDAGVLIDPASVDSITEAIKTIDGWSDSERQENITRGIERAAHYNWANSTASLLAAAREVK